MTDSELLRQYTGSRSEAAFTELFDRYGRSVYLTCRRALRDAHLAHDATQTVFSLLIARADGLRDGPLGPWLRQTAVFVSANIGRSLQLRRKYEHRAVGMRPLERSHGEHSEVHELVDRLLRELGPEEREAVVLRYLSDMSPGEVAAAQRISHEAVKKRLSRALARLRRAAATASLSLLAPISDSIRRWLPGTSEPRRIVRHCSGFGGKGARHIVLRVLLGKPTLASVALLSAILVGTAATTEANRSPTSSGQLASAVPVSGTIGQRLQGHMPPLTLRRVPLAEGLALLQEKSGIEMRVDWQSLASAGVDAQTPLVAHLPDSTVEQDLRQVLCAAAAPGRLSYRIDNNRVVIFPTDSQTPRTSTGTLLALR